MSHLKSSIILAVEKQTNKQLRLISQRRHVSTCCHTLTQVFSRSRTCISTQTNIQLLNASNYAHLLFTPPRRGYIFVSHPLRKNINFCYLVKLWPKYPRPKKKMFDQESTRTRRARARRPVLCRPENCVHLAGARTGSPSGNYRKLASSSPIFPTDTGYSLFVLY